MTTLLPPSEKTLRLGQFDPPALAGRRETTVHPGRPRHRIGAALALLVVGAWMISSFWVAVQFRSPRQPFEAPTAGQSWVRSPEAGPRAYFRLLFPIPDTPPQSVTLAEAPRTTLEG